MRTTKILFWLVLLTGSVGAGAQVIDPIGIGFRAGPYGGGFTGKVFFNPHLALEGQINGSASYYMEDGTKTWGPSFTLGALLEYNIIFPDPSWRIYIGPGLHAGSWDRYNRREYENAAPTQGIFGIDGILGIEYMFKTIPLGLSADVKPALNVSVETAFFPDNMFGLSARYYFGHRVKMANTETYIDAENAGRGEQ